MLKFLLDAGADLYIINDVSVIKLPYSWKFSRDPIFAFFAVDWQTTK